MIKKKLQLSSKRIMIRMKPVSVKITKVALLKPQSHIACGVFCDGFFCLFLRRPCGSAVAKQGQTVFLEAAVAVDRLARS